MFLKLVGRICIDTDAGGMLNKITTNNNEQYILSIRQNS